MRDVQRLMGCLVYAGGHGGGLKGSPYADLLGEGLWEEALFRAVPSMYLSGAMLRGRTRFEEETGARNGAIHTYLPRPIPGHFHNCSTETLG